MSKLPMPFDNPTTYPGHSGIDFPQPAGTPILASADGVIVSRGFNARGGNYVWVKYPDHPAVGYHHMPNHNHVPPLNSVVLFGEQIGEVGSTGNSTGPHLHSEVMGRGTTDGYWTVFDRNKTVHDTAEKEDEEMDFFNLQGKSGSHRAGLFAVYRGNADGKLYARRLTTDVMGTGYPTMPHEALAALKATMPFIGL